MLELHVWGTTKEFSPIYPECVALVTFFHLYVAPDLYRIVPSSNTNLSPTGKLPVLIDTATNEKITNYQLIIDYVMLRTESDKEESNYRIHRIRDDTENLNNLALVTLVETKLSVITDYVLYINGQNYEKYTRKLFKEYLPFPMMYNQPLTQYNLAKSRCLSLGLVPNKDFFGNDTDIVKKDDEIKPLSTLHDKQLMQKKQSTLALKESKNSLRCMNLLSSYINEFVIIADNNDHEGYLFKASELSSSELLLFAHIYCMTNQNIPDKFIGTFIESSYPFYFKQCNELIEYLSSSNMNFRNVDSYESPSLVNEIKFRAGMLSY